MGGKRATSTSSSQSGSGQKWAEPYAREGAQDVLGVFNAQQPHLQNLQGDLLGQLGSLRGQGQRMGQVSNQASGFQSDVLGGKYLHGNPYIRNIMGQMGEQITDQVGSQFASAGRYGSGAYTGTLADSLSDGFMKLLYGNYATEMDRMGQAAEQSQLAQYQNNQQQLAGTQLASQVPYEGVNSMASGLGALFSGGDEKSKQKGAKPGLLDYAAQAASNAAAAYAGKSDRRLKKDIVKVGEYDDGLGIYEWTFKNDPDAQRCRGVMADEVKELRPWAYIKGFVNGIYDGVNYSALNESA